MKLVDEDILTVMQTLSASLFESPIAPAQDLAMTPQAPGSRVPVQGSFHGSVSVSCSPRLARRLAARMFGVDEASVCDADMEDAVFELANVVAGNFKALMPRPIEIGLPQADTQVPGESLCQRLAFACEGEPLVISVFENHGS